MADEKGPYLQYAVVCEKVLHEKDEVLSLVRLIDQVTVTVTTVAGAGEPPPFLPPPIVGVTFALALKSGDFQGSAAVKLRIETPSDFKWPELEATMHLTGEDRGGNLIVPMQFPAQDEGVYWFVVEVNGRFMTRIPLRIVKQTVTQTLPPQLG